MLLTFTPPAAALEISSGATAVGPRLVAAADGHLAGRRCVCPVRDVSPARHRPEFLLHGERLGLDPGFNVLDRTDAADLMDVVRQRLGLSKTEKRFPRKDTCLAIYSHRVNAQLPLRRTLELLFPWCLEWEDALTALCREYVDAKLAQQLLDYDDLLLYWQLMMAEPDIAAGIGARFDHVLVDEFQDTNRLQAGILAALRPDGAGSRSVVTTRRRSTLPRGDGREHPRVSRGFDPHARIVTLEQNYRSTQPVLDAANALMAEAGPQYRKDLRSSCGAVRDRYTWWVQDDQAQAGYVIEQRLIARERGVDCGARRCSFARRSQRSARAGAHAANIPFVKYGGLKFLEAAHVKDLLAVLRLADNPRNRSRRFAAAAAARHGAVRTRPRVCDAFEVRGHRFECAVAAAGAAAASRGLSALSALLVAIGGTATPWAGQITQCGTGQPQLDRLYDTRAVRRAISSSSSGSQCSTRRARRS